MRWWATRATAVLALGTLLALSRAPVAVVRAQAPPANRVPYPAQLTLAPGESVTLYDPNPTVPSGAPSTPDGYQFGFGAATVAVINSTPDPLDVSSDGETLTLGETAQQTLQLLQRVAEKPPTTNSGDTFVIFSVGSGAPDGSPEHLRQCGAVDRSAETVRCTIDPSFVGGNTLTVTATAVTGGERSANLQPGERASLFVAAASGDAAALDVADNTREPLQTVWDGQSLSATVADGYLLGGSVSFAGTPAPRRSTTDAGCAPTSDSNGLACPIAGLPAADVSLHATLILPATTLSLPYSDVAGAGTLTLTPSGTDPVSGSESVDAVLQGSAATLTGNGVMRPWEDTGDIRLALTFTKLDGSQLLLEGVLYEKGGTFGGRGYSLSLNRVPVEDRWRAGTLQPPRDDILFIISLAVELVRPDVQRQSGSANIVLPQLADDGAHGVFVLPVGSSGATDGRAGESVDLRASLITPDLPLPTSDTFTFDFGDGSVPVTVGAQSHNGLAFGQSPSVQHTYAQPGDYTVIVYLDGRLGLRLFGASVLHVAAAGS